MPDELHLARETPPFEVSKGKVRVAALAGRATEGDVVLHEPQQRASARRWLAALLAVVAIAACSAPAASPSPSPAADVDFQPNAWQQLLAGAGLEGQVSLDLALKAFVMAIGPLPGVPDPRPPLPTPDEIGPGEVAIQWVFQHWDELTSEQQTAVNGYLDPGPDAIVVEPLPADAEPSPAAERVLLGGIGLVALEDETPLQRYQGMLRDAEIVIINRLGRVRTRPYALTVNSQQVDPEGLEQGAHALAYAFDWFGTCSIHLNPILVTRVRASVEISATLAHELFHCFQNELGSPVGRGIWVVEGEAEFVGESAGGPSAIGRSWWARYIDTPGTALFARTYDALGFYLHMAERGVNVWTLLDKMYKSGGGAASYHDGADPGGDGFLYSWSSGFFKDPRLAGEWDAQGPWTFPYVPAPETINVPVGDPIPFNTAPFTNRVALVVTTADIVNFNTKGFARIRDAAGFVQDGLPDVNFCSKAGGDCACPPGQDYTGPVLAPLGFPAFLAITGATDGVTGAITGFGLDDFCVPSGSPGASPPGGSGTGSTPPCPRGCAGSNGEPHLRTVDNFAYDLQSAGEYVLLRSPDDSIEIQARQEPRGATDATDISVNTGVAVRANGHRVGVYTGDDGLIVHVDGQVSELETAMDLGNGARVVRYESGIEVDLPDGSRVYAVAMRSSCCLNIVVAPSDSLRADGAGLLGNVAAGTMPVPALPDGTRLPRVETAHDRFVALYETLAPAWLVTDTTTLFDYEDGKTTADYVLDGFPQEAQIRTVEDLTPDERATAATTCATVTDQDLLLECMFDVTVSDLENWAQLYGITDKFIAGGTDILDSPAPDPDALPDGFVELLPSVVAVNGAAVGPAGIAYVSVQESATKYAVLAVNLADGTLSARLDASGGGRVALAGGSVWVGGLDGFASCSITSLEPATLARQGSVTVPCDFLGSAFVSFDDAIWFLDRTTADADAHGGRLRRIDPATREVTGDVVVPFVNGYLAATTQALFWLAEGSPTTRPEDASVYRLLPNETALTSFGPLGATGQPLLGAQFFPVGEGFWAWPQFDAAPVYRTSPGDQGQPLAIAGPLVGADDSALYANQISTFDSTPELWRHPVDGSAPTRVALGVTLQTTVGDQSLSYFDNAPLLFDQGYAVKLWVVPSRVEQSVNSLVMQATPLP